MWTGEPDSCRKRNGTLIIPSVSARPPMCSGTPSAAKGLASLTLRLFTRYRRGSDRPIADTNLDWHQYAMDRRSQGAVKPTELVRFETFALLALAFGFVSFPFARIGYFAPIMIYAAHVGLVLWISRYGSQVGRIIWSVLFGLGIGLLIAGSLIAFTNEISIPLTPASTLCFIAGLGCNGFAAISVWDRATTSWLLNREY